MAALNGYEPDGKFTERSDWGAIHIFKWKTCKFVDGKFRQSA